MGNSYPQAWYRTGAEAGMSFNETLEYVKFAVHERPMCVWGADLHHENLEFLERIDPGFFSHLTRVHDIDQNKDSPQRAATALSVAYGMALEALFAVIGATVQAPECVVGWLNSYHVEELRDLVRDITHQRLKYARRQFRPVSWDHIAGVIFMGSASANGTDLRSIFARWWENLAQHFLSQDRTDEYNSLKHGFRVMPGSLKVSMRVEDQIIFEHEAVTSHRFFSIQRADWAKHHFTLRERFATIAPGRIQAALAMIDASIRNISAVTRARLAGDESAPLIVPQNLDAFERAWSEVPDLSALNAGGSVGVDPLDQFTKDEVLAVYEEP